MSIEQEKLNALNQALGKIEKEFGKGSVMKLGEATSMAIDVISTGSIGLDIAVGIGGLPKGRIIEVYGPESSGKTTVALHTIAEAQKQGGIAAFIDGIEDELLALPHLCFSFFFYMWYISLGFIDAIIDRVTHRKVKWAKTVRFNQEEIKPEEIEV